MLRTKAFLLFLTLMWVIGAAVPSSAQRPMSPLKELKLQQKMQRRQIKLQEKAWKRSFHGRRIPRAERLLTKHEYDREMRDLRARQKDELEQMKDQLRLQRAAIRHGLTG